MDRVEIEVDSSFWGQCMGRLVLVWSRLSVRIAFVITIFFYLFIAIAMTETPQYRYLLVILACVVLGMWLTPIASALVGSIVDYRKGNKCIIYLGCDGVEFEYSQIRVCFKWEHFFGFRETKRRFIIFAKAGTNVSLAKRKMAEEKIPIVRKILDDTNLEKFT